MAGKVLNIKLFNPLKLRSGLTGKCLAICHYSYNLPLAVMLRDTTPTRKQFEKYDFRHRNRQHYT